MQTQTAYYPSQPQKKAPRAAIYFTVLSVIFFIGNIFLPIIFDLAFEHFVANPLGIILSFIPLGFYIFIDILLFLKKKNFLLIVPAAYLLICSSFSLLIGFANIDSAGPTGTYSLSYYVFNFFRVLLEMPALLILLIDVIVVLVKQLSFLKEVTRVLHYFYKAAIIISLVCGIISQVFYMLYLIELIDFLPEASIFFLYLPFNILQFVFAFLAFNDLKHWVDDETTNSQEKVDFTLFADDKVAKEQRNEFYIPTDMHVCLLLVFGFIWSYIWIYKVTQYTNKLHTQPKRDAISQLLLCALIPFYSIYWTYKTAKAIDVLAHKKGVPSDLAVLCAILTAFVGSPAYILMQEKINVTVSTDCEECETEEEAVIRTTDSPFYINTLKHVALLIVTGGVWQYIWTFKTTNCTNRLSGEQRNSTTELLLCIFVPFYNVYWAYKTAKIVDTLAEAKGIESRLAHLCPALELIISTYAPMLIQEKINEILTAPEKDD